MNFTVDGSSPLRGWRAVRSIAVAVAENTPSWMRRACRPWRRTSSTSRMRPVPRTSRNTSEKRQRAGTIDTFGVRMFRECSSRRAW
ncbi:hypothetical protein ACTMTF_01695 [Nonomuraea sp. ZG12]|uniref:hypothetical protein n=1 Tax=Nonomuraea sp. ZG12 TaxID=3452207 RepID=UPI003F8CBB8B